MPEHGAFVCSLFNKRGPALWKGPGCACAAVAAPLQACLPASCLARSVDFKAKVVDIDGRRVKLVGGAGNTLSLQSSTEEESAWELQGRPALLAVGAFSQSALTAIAACLH